MNATERTLRTLSRMAQTHYPRFIFGLPLGRHELPVFTYHDVTPAQFVRDLEFLSHNGYRTLGLDEFMAAACGKTTPRRCVLLTFDDARKSFHAAALPLLREFCCRAALFAPTYWMNDPAERGGADLFMSWAQL